MPMNCRDGWSTCLRWLKTWVTDYVCQRTEMEIAPARESYDRLNPMAAPHGHGVHPVGCLIWLRPKAQAQSVSQLPKLIQIRTTAMGAQSKRWAS